MMNRQFLISSASVLALGIAAATACSTSPTTQGNPPGTAGSGTAGSTAGVSTGGVGTAGNATGGSFTQGGIVGTGGSTAGTGGATTAGTGGAATAGTGGVGTAGTGGGGGVGGGSVACKAGTVGINGSGLTVSDPLISAFKYAPAPGGNMAKMAYDPVGKKVVILGLDGKMYALDPNVALPATAVTTAVTTTAAYDSGGYAANAGYGDHRGIVFGPDGTLYVLANQGGGNVGTNIKKGVLVGTGPARTWTTIVTTSQGFANGGTNFDHSFSGIAISPDGMSLYFSSGSRTDHGEPEKADREVPLSSAIFKVPTTGTSDLKNDDATLAPFLFADGTRNAFDMAFNAAGDLISTDNGPDMDLPDEINFVEQGKHYGFPWRFGAVDNPVREAAYSATGDKRLHTGYQAVDTGKYVADAAFPAVPAGKTFTDPILNMGPDANFFRADKNAAPTQAGATGLAGVSGHRSPLGIAFDTAGASCGAYYKQGLVLSYGSVDPAAVNDGGEDLLAIALTKGGDGKYTMAAKQVAKGIKTPMDSVMVGNKFFTVSYGGGTVYVFVLPTP
jgi:Glucose / Sorbosone dehydrogenase